MGIAAAAAGAGRAAGQGADAAPRPVPARVASINLCTDQLAMMVGAPGQLRSVTYLAADPAISAMAEAAAALPQNRGRAEEIFLMRPDLVLAGTWSDPAATAMMERVGLRVERFAPGASFADIRGNITRMGEVLGQPARAAAILRDFDARLAALSASVADRPRLRAAHYAPNGYTFGGATLTGQILAAAGYDNIADDYGLAAGGTLALERLVMAAPDIVLTGTRDPGPSRGSAILSHPALAALPRAGVATGADWACATPFVLDAVERLIAARPDTEGAAP
jgi:iron complex transport system substrate-binding protein